MPNINRPRTKRDSAYRTQLDKLDDLRGSVVENGTIVECLGVYYASIEGDWFPFAPLNNESLQIGWARYDDTQYTSETPSIFSANTPFSLYNNAGVAIDQYNLFMYNSNDQLFMLEEGSTYALTVAFKAYLNTNNGHIELSFNAQDDADYSNIGDVIIFPKGNGEEHIFSRSFNFYCTEFASISGINLLMTASHSGAIYDVKYFIEKLSHA
jgi:hypothetical protein